MIILGISFIIFNILYGIDAWNSVPQYDEIIINTLTEYINQISLNNKGQPINIRASFKFVEEHPIDTDILLKLVPTLSEQHQLAAWNYMSSVDIDNNYTKLSAGKLKGLYEVSHANIGQKMQNVEAKPSSKYWWVTPIIIGVVFTTLNLISN